MALHTARIIQALYGVTEIGILETESLVAFLEREYGIKQGVA
jgi:hypothetical protein